MYIYVYVTKDRGVLQYLVTNIGRMTFLYRWFPLLSVKSVFKSQYLSGRYRPILECPLSVHLYLET